MIKIFTDASFEKYFCPDRRVFKRIEITSSFCFQYSLLQWWLKPLLEFVGRIQSRIVFSNLWSWGKNLLRLCLFIFDLLFVPFLRRKFQTKFWYFGDFEYKMSLFVFRLCFWVAWLPPIKKFTAKKIRQKISFSFDVFNFKVKHTLNYLLSCKNLFWCNILNILL